MVLTSDVTPGSVVYKGRWEVLSAGRGVGWGVLLTGGHVARSVNKGITKEASISCVLLTVKYKNIYINLTPGDKKSLPLNYKEVNKLTRN